jgi:hypothetical protein
MWNTREYAKMGTCKEIIELRNICLTIYKSAVVFDAGISKCER